MASSPPETTPLPTGESEASPSPEVRPNAPTVGLGGCLTGFVIGGLTLWGGNALLSFFGVRGGLRTGLELGVMGLALGACLFLWKVAATANQIAKESDEP